MNKFLFKEIWIVTESDGVQKNQFIKLSPVKVGDKTSGNFRVVKVEHKMQKMKMRLKGVKNEIQSYP